MKIVRHNVFETNSSSTHSISINSDTELYDSIIPDKNGVITLTGGEFGWEWKKTNDAFVKANYCAVDVIDNEDLKDMLRSVIIEHTGAKNVVFGFKLKFIGEDYSTYDSYIDHQSEGTSHPAFTSFENLKNFIFNPRSYLFIGNDNSEEPPNFYDIDEKDFTHKVLLEGTEEIFKIKESDINNDDKIIDVILNLFSRNKHNKYYDINSCYGTKAMCQDSGVDLKNKTLKIVKEFPIYKKNGEFDRYKCEAEKFLKFSIEKL